MAAQKSAKPMTAPEMAQAKGDPSALARAVDRLDLKDPRVIEVGNYKVTIAPK